MFVRGVLISLSVLLSDGLTPKRLPNGKIIKFKSNFKHPESDLKIITPGSASIISRNWLQNIVVDVFSKENSKLKNNQFSDTSILIMMICIL